MRIEVGEGRKTLKVVINDYKPVVKFEIPQGDPRPKHEICLEGIKASLGDQEVRLWLEQSENKIKIKKRLGLNEHVFGLGEKALPLDRRRTRCIFFNYDHHGYQLYSDPLYCSIPFMIFVDDKKAYGIFVNSTAPIIADFGVMEYDKATIEVQDEAVELYIIFGPKVKEVVEIYSEITGRPFIPPRWALEYMISRYSYYPQDYVLKLVEKISKDVKIGALFLDIDYMDGFKIFTWDKNKFPNAKEMVKKLEEMGVRTIVSISPYVKVDEEYEVYREAENLCVTKGDKPYLAKGWPGTCILPDFFNEETRKWWADKIDEFARNYGIAGIWLDMNEPTVFNPKRKYVEMSKRIDLLYLAENYVSRHHKELKEILDLSPDLEVIHKLDDSRKMKHFYVRNAYPYFQAMATYEGLRRVHDKPFILSRSGYAGIQKYAAIWTGDMPSTWEALRYSIPILLNLSISGVAFCGLDLGGFIGRSDPELLVRWHQAFVFIPLYRLHKDKWGNDTEIFRLPSKHREAIKRAISLRYYFLPYLWHLAWEANLKGSPIIRPLFYEFQEDDCYLIEDEYMLGPHVLYAPILEKGAERRDVYLPSSKWFDYWSGEILEGPAWIKSSTEMPLFIKDGSAIPVEKGLILFGNGTWEIYHGEGEKAKIVYEGDRIMQELDRIEIEELVIIGSDASYAIVDGLKAKLLKERNKLRVFVNKKFEEIILKK